MHVGQADSVFVAIADPTRRQILDRLRQGPHPAGELGVGLGITQPAVSQHLGVLLGAGLVTRERRGRLQMYQLSHGVLAGVADWVAAYSAFWDDRLNRLGQYLAKRNPQPGSEGDPLEPRR